MLRTLPGSALLLLLCAANVHGQTGTKANELDAVIIRENRIQGTYKNENKNVQIIDSRQISALPVKSVAELLSYVAGVDLQQRGPWGAQADVSIQGSTFDEVLVLINGVKISDPQTGHNMLNLPVPLASIDHVEVLYGPAARTYGVNALAGVINIITKIPTQPEVTAQVYTGSSFKKDTGNGNTYMGWGAQASAAINGKNQSHILSIAHDEVNGYRYNTAGDATRLFYQDQFILKDKSTIDAMAGYAYNSYGANGFYAAPGDKEAKETAQTALASVGYTFHPVKKLSITPRISYRYGKDDYLYIRQHPEKYHNIHETNVVTGEVQASLQTSHGVAGAGIEARNEAINSSNLGRHDRNNLGFSAEYKHYFSPRFNMSAGVYGNYNSDYGWELFPGIDAGYTFAKSWKAIANASTGERLPTYTDLYYAGPGNIGNPLLKPEHTAYGEAGIQTDKRFLFVRLTGFYRRTTDFIDWVRASASNPWQPQNFQSINTPGINLQAKWKLSQYLRLPEQYQFALNGSYTYLNPDVKATTDKMSKYTITSLRNQACLSLTSLLLRKVIVDVNGRYLQRINGNDYTLLDARVGYEWKQWRVYADVNNLLDTQYKEIGAVPLPGRWYTIGITYHAKW